MFLRATRYHIYIISRSAKLATNVAKLEGVIMCCTGVTAGRKTKHKRDIRHDKSNNEILVSYINNGVKRETSNMLFMLFSRSS